jgi:undecaprenyl diphosphate synthase
MDGNGRWAQQRGLPRIEGHRIGAESVKDIVRAARQLGIEALTLYAFSAQNWARPAEEVTALMVLLRDYLLEERPEIMDNDIRLLAIGDIERLPSFVREPLDALTADSAGNRSMKLVLALSYGGRESIARAARAAIAAVRAGTLAAEDLDVTRFNALMPTGELPPLDLLIRTSGEQRISNFMLWELAYAELVFTETPWPDFRRQQLYDALELYAQRERRFGLTGAQVLGGQSDLGLEPPAASAADTASPPTGNADEGAERSPADASMPD